MPGKSPSQPKQTVLVVEDDPILRSQLQEWLEEEGRFNVILAPSARGALDQLAATRPDLVVLDLVLPDRSGYEVCEHIRKEPRTREVPVLAVSARQTPSHRAQAEEAGASLYMAKPLAKRELLKNVRALLPGAGEEGRKP
ncbi:MAG TPA: response regulator [Myxococcales bacterium]|nr:response regulator [Myxococcales bacterium]